jgi:hypothetical protein
VASYADETRIVEFQRSLITNNPDDVHFEERGKAMFGREP